MGGTDQAHMLSWNGTGIYIEYNVKHPILTGNTYSNNTNADLLAAGRLHRRWIGM